MPDYAIGQSPNDNWIRDHAVELAPGMVGGCVATALCQERVRLTSIFGVATIAFDRRSGVSCCQCVKALPP